MKTVCILTGGTSGIGRATALALVQKGCVVYELSRRNNATPGTNHLCVDVTNNAAVTAGVQTVLQREGQIDLLINNAGFGISGAVEFTGIEQAQQQFNVNFFGAVRLCHAVLPVMRQQKRGRIVNIGSVAGFIPIPFQAYYSATKAALSAYTAALASEVAPFGITAVCVQPGDIKTGFTAARQKTVLGNEVYGGRIARSVAKMEKDEQTGMTPERAAKTIVKTALGRSRSPARCIGFSYKLISLLVRLLPRRTAQVLVAKLYAK